MESQFKVRDMALDTLHEMISDRDKMIGRYKAELRKYFDAKHDFETRNDYNSFIQMKKAEKNLQHMSSVLYPRNL